MLEGIIDMEEKHADELADLLVVYPKNGSQKGGPQRRSKRARHLGRNAPFKVTVLQCPMSQVS
jgi:hypothetical protein